MELRPIFSIFCIIITSFCVFSQDDINLSVDNSQETSMLTSESKSENVTNPFDESSGLSTAISSGFDGSSTKTFDYKKTQEWGKYKVLRAVGWASLGVGFTTAFYGLIGLGLSLNDGGNGHPFIAIIATGGTLILSSIPILIIANKYKRKAKKMVMNVGVTSINAPTISNRIDYTPGLSFVLNF